MGANVFAVPVFFIVFRECIETSIIVAILLAFLKQSLGGPEHNQKAYKRLKRHVWLGIAIGGFLVLAIGGGMIGAFYSLGLDAWSKTEDLWEGIFSLVASVIITLMGGAILRVSKMQAKWRAKILKALEKQKSSSMGERAEKYALFILPFITILREGLEAVIFVGGVGLSYPVTAFPLPVILGLLAGSLVGVFIYKGGNQVRLQLFLIVSTCFLYLVAAGLFSRGVWGIEMYRFNKATGGDIGETGDGPGSYDINESVWHVNCCSPELNGGGGWGIFNALFGWTNSASYGSVLSYNLYWVAIIAGFGFMYWRERKTTLVENDSEAESEETKAGAFAEPLAADKSKATTVVDESQTKETV